MTEDFLPCAISVGFTGEPTDENGLVYLRARYYHPALGVFTSLDPVEFVNRYGYVGSNPVNYTDPSGMCTVGFCIGSLLLPVDGPTFDVFACGCAIALGVITISAIAKTLRQIGMDETIIEDITFNIQKAADSHVELAGLLNSGETPTPTPTLILPTIPPYMPIPTTNPTTTATVSPTATPTATPTVITPPTVVGTQTATPTAVLAPTPAIANATPNSGITPTFNPAPTTTGTPPPCPTPTLTEVWDRKPIVLDLGPGLNFSEISNILAARPNHKVIAIDDFSGSVGQNTALNLITSMFPVDVQIGRLELILGVNYGNPNALGNRKAVEAISFYPNHLSVLRGDITNAITFHIESGGRFYAATEAENIYNVLTRSVNGLLELIETRGPISSEKVRLGQNGPNIPYGSSLFSFLPENQSHTVFDLYGMRL